MSTFLKLVGEKIRQLRKANGLTQEELAEKSNLQYSYISGVEHGDRNVSLLTLEKIIKALDVTPETIFNFRDIDINDGVNDKKEILEIHNDFLQKRDIEEIKALHKISLDITKLIDSKK